MHDQILNLIAGADTPISATDIRAELGLKHIGKLRSMLRDMVHDEEIERANGGGYVVRGIVKHEFPTTDRAAVDKREKNTMLSKGVGDLWKENKINSIEDAEQAADQDKGVPVALYRLEEKLNATDFAIPKLVNAEMKGAMLYKFEQIMDESIATQCRELREWIGLVVNWDKLNSD